MLTLLLVPAAVPASNPGQGAPELAGFAPADAGLFVELHDGADLLVRLLEPSLWLTLAELAGQPASDEEAAVWRERIRAATGLEPAEAVRVLFSRSVAYVGEGLGRSSDAVVLCRPARDLNDLLRDWEAQPLFERGPVRVLRLPNRVGIAIRDDLLAFGDVTRPDGMFARVVACLAGADEASLAQRAEFVALRKRVPERLAGLIYARVAPMPPPRLRGTAVPASQPATAPAGDETGAAVARLPASLPDPGVAADGSASPEGVAGAAAASRGVMIGLERMGVTLTLNVAGGPPATAAQPKAANGFREGEAGPAQDVRRTMSYLESLPERTLLAWELGLDYEQLADVLDGLPPQNVVRIFQTLHERGGGLNRLSQLIDPLVGIAIGVVSPAERSADSPPAPAVALLLTLRAEEAVAEWESLFHSSASIFNLLALKLGFRVTLPGIETLRIGDVRAEQLDMSRLLGERPHETPLGELHLSWAESDGVLILATHSDWLRQILAARRGRAATLEPLLNREMRRAVGATRVYIQAGPLADLGELWLEYFEQNMPELLHERWWRDYQPGGAAVRLGVAVRQGDNPPGSLRVEAVLPHHPADGLLRSGDVLLGAERRRFSTSQPAAELQQMLAGRPNSRWIDLILQRDGLVQVRRVPLPFVDPIQLLRRTTAIGRAVQRAAYHDQSDPSGPRGVLTVELRRAAEPLYEFPLAPRLEPVASPPVELPAAPAPAPGP